jgi:Glyoxalase-like domain
VGLRGVARADGWAVRCPDLDGLAGRLGLEIQTGSRAAPDGGTLRWRTAGVERAAAEPSLPFFIAWAPGAPFPGAGDAGVELERLDLRGDGARLAEWLGGAGLPVAIEPGPAAVERIVLRSAAGAFAFDASTLM